MKKIAILLIAVLVVSVVFLSGCFSDKDKFIGAWKNSLGITVYTFYDDDTYKGTATSGTYEIKDGKITCISGSFIRSYEYEFLNDDNTLILNGIGGAGSYTLTKV